MNTITFDAVKKLFPPRDRNAHKGNFGRLLCITGSLRMPGAACMSLHAALRCGVGLLTAAVPHQNIPILAAQCWESMYLPLCTDEKGFITWHRNEEILLDALPKASSVLIGCGLGQTPETALLLENITKNTSAPLIVDADGINLLAERIDIVRERNAPLILTPHPGEMARLVKISAQTVQQNRLETLHAFCEMLPKAVLALKGHETLVGQGEQVWRNPTGNPGMSRGGSGDVLAGMIAAFAAQGLKPADAVCAGVYIHGMAGDIAAEKYSEAAMLPRDLIACIPEVFLRIEKEQ